VARSVAVVSVVMALCDHVRPVPHSRVLDGTAPIP
jgi:hypothetical protein